MSAQKTTHVWCTHRYRTEIPEPAPSLSWHGALIGGIWVFPTIKITMTRKVRMYCGLSVKKNMHETPHSVRRSWAHLFAFVSACVVSKNLNTSNWSSSCEKPTYLDSTYPCITYWSTLGHLHQYILRKCFQISILKWHQPTNQSTNCSTMGLVHINGANTAHSQALGTSQLTNV